MKKRSLKLSLLGLVTLTISAGCGGGGSRLDFTSRTHDIRVSFRLPLGWAVEGRPEEGKADFAEKENAENRG